MTGRVYCTLTVPPFLLLVRLGTWGSSLTAPFHLKLTLTVQSGLVTFTFVILLAFVHLSPHTVLPSLFTHSSPLASITVIPFYLVYHKLLHKLQLSQNSAARIITRTPSLQHITPSLQQLHWLPIKFRIEFKILLLTYKTLHNLATLPLRSHSALQPFVPLHWVFSIHPGVEPGGVQGWPWPPLT